MNKEKKDQNKKSGKKIERERVHCQKANKYRKNQGKDRQNKKELRRIIQGEGKDKAVLRQTGKYTQKGGWY